MDGERPTRTATVTFTYSASDAGELHPALSDGELGSAAVELARQAIADGAFEPSAVTVEHDVPGGGAAPLATLDADTEQELVRVLLAGRDAQASPEDIAAGAAAAQRLVVHGLALLPAILAAAGRTFDDEATASAYQAIGQALREYEQGSFSTLAERRIREALFGAGR